MTDPGSERGSPDGMPRWVKVFLIIAIVLAVAFVVTRLAGVEHGPALHGPGGNTPTADVTQDHSPPIDHSP